MTDSARHAPSAICGTCHRRLVPADSYDDAGTLLGVSFTHQLLAVGQSPCDKLDPVTFEAGGSHPEQVSICDFCGGEPDAGWVYPAEDFPCPGDPDLRMIGEWVACEPCHTDIGAKAWDRMAERQGRVHGFFMTRQARTHFVGIFRAFDMHRLGDPRPL